MRIDRNKLYKIKAVLQKMTKENSNVYFQYKAVKNLKIINDEIESLQEVSNLDDEIIKQGEEYEKERIALCEELCNKDEEGNPIIIDDKGNKIEYGSQAKGAHYEMSDDAKLKIDSKIEELSTSKYKEYFEKREAKEEEFVKLLSEEVDLPLISFDLKIMPTEVSGEDIEVLLDLIQE